MYLIRIERGREREVKITALSDGEEIVQGGRVVTRPRPIFSRLVKPGVAVAQNTKPQYAIAAAKIVLEEELQRQKGKDLRQQRRSSEVKQ